MSLAVELAQVWVPVMPEVSRLSGGVDRIAGDVEKRFGRVGKVMGSQMLSGVDTAKRKVVDSLRDVEKRTTSLTKVTKAQEAAAAAVAKAKAADADATGRLVIAEQKLEQVKNNAKATDLQRAAAAEAVNRAKRAQVITDGNLTLLAQRQASAQKDLARETRGLASAQKAHQSAQSALKDAPVAKLPFGARLAAMAEQEGAESGSRFMSGFKRMLGAGTALAAGGGFIASVKSAIDLGVGMESNLNRLKGVTSASGAEMANAAKLAQQLGADTSIVGASAADAAAGMLELAKGGLTMQQAMAAAPGTLKLAAAAAIDAATAAESQATILNSYQLGADQADHVADALANVANAAQGEVPDFMLGMQQASAVAHGFGISMDETVSVLGLFAKAGIKGSDAGTSLKTMLTHLANPSDQASAAMDRLGLKIRNVDTGQFVGMRELFRQIGDASSKMRPDDFQEAAATLFGTDAIRGAMIAGTQGIETLDAMSTAVQKVGGASDMAAANMQGLPGVIEKISNAADTGKLAFYDFIKPMLESGGNQMVDWLGKIPGIFDQLKSGGGDGVRLLVQGWKDISGAVKDIAPTIGTVVSQFAKGAAGTVVLGWSALGQALKIIEPPLKVVLDLFTKIPGLGMAVAGLFTALYLKSKLAGPAITTAAKASELFGKAFSGWKTPLKQAADSMDYVNMATGNTVTKQRGYMTQLKDAYRNASDGAERFHRTAGVTGTAMSAMKSAGGGVLSLLGGPWGVAALGVTTALGMIASAHEDAARKAEEQKRQEQELLATLDETTGKVTEATRAKVRDRLQAEDEHGTTDLGRLKSYGLDTSLGVDAATGTGDASAYTKIASVAQQHITSGLSGEEGQRLTKVAADAGVSTEELNSALLHQGNALDTVNKKIADYNKAQYDAAGANQQGWQPAFKDGNALLQSMIDSMGTGDESIITLTQNINKMRDQFDAGTQKAQEGTAALNGQWQASEALKQKYAELGATITAVPTDKQVQVEVDPARFADFKAKMEEAGNSVEQIPGVAGGPAVAKVTANSDQAIQELAALVVKIQQTQAEMDVRVRYRDSGGQEINPSQLVTPGFIPAVPGESGRPRGGGRAAGGRVDSSGRISGPGSGTSDSILARVFGGDPIAVSRGESINTESSTRKNWGLIDAMNKGWTPPPDFLRRLVHGYSGGGLVGGPESVEDIADSLAGTPYVRGGHSPSGVDCSGAASVLVNAALGLNPYGDRMATGNAAEWITARGGVIGEGPPGTLRVGWKNGGPGGGHMAVTLPDGRNAESGGSHGTFLVGAGAAGAGDFPNQAYIPMDAMYPDGWPSGGGGGGYGGGGGGGYGGGGSGGGPTAAEQRSLRNASQKVDDTAQSLKQAQGALDELDAKGETDPKKREAAEYRVAKAEREHQDALDDLGSKQEEVNRKSADRGSKGDKDKGPDAAGFGQGLLKGAMEGLGFDGEIFSDPTQWGIFKLGTGMANMFGGLMKNWNWKGIENAQKRGGAPLGAPSPHGGTGAAPGPISDGGLGNFDFGAGGGEGLSAIGDNLLPQVKDFLPNSQQPGPQQQPSVVDARIDLTGANIGMDPNALRSQIHTEQNARTRTNSAGLPTG